MCQAWDQRNSLFIKDGDGASVKIRDSCTAVVVALTWTGCRLWKGGSSYSDSSETKSCAAAPRCDERDIRDFSCFSRLTWPRWGDLSDGMERSLGFVLARGKSSIWSVRKTHATLLTFRPFDLSTLACHPKLC